MLYSIDYDVVVENYIEIIRYCVKYSDTFTVITNLKKPYSKKPPNCEHDAVMEGLKPYLMEQQVGIRNWPGTIVKDNHKVMNRYLAKREAGYELIKLPNIFLPLKYNLSEDICFYRGNDLWFATTSHERWAEYDNELKRDVTFFRSFLPKE